jgi:hypothetical protein
MKTSKYPNIQVTDAQIDAFCIWAIEQYGNYITYCEAIQSVELTQYIRMNILSYEMVDVLIQTDMYVGIRSVDPRITSLQIRRQSILIKIVFIKTKLGRLAFANEVAAIRAQQTEMYRQQAMLRTRQTLEYVMVDDELIPINALITRKIVQQKLGDDEKHQSMAEDCAICFIKHLMTATCVIPCGHQFGSKCFASWKNNTCPLCRTPCMVVTEFISDKRRRYFTDEESETLSQVPKQMM